MEANNPDHEIVDPELSALEQRLAAWRPSPGALDRDRMLYDAGRAAARAENRLQSWRLATAALLVISIGLGGLLVYQRSLRLLDRDLLAQEQARRHALETALAAGDRPLEPAPGISAPAVQATSIQRLPPTSYFILTARLTRSGQDLSAPDLDFEPEPQRPGSHPSEMMPRPGPRQLQPGDIRRVLEL
jgi:hypothetical protein